VKDISDLINYSEDYQFQMIEMNLMKTFVDNPEYSIVGKKFNSTKNRIYHLQRGKTKGSPERALAEKDLSFPEEHETEFLKFVSEMTSNCIVDICRETLKIIPYEAKVQYEEFLERLKQKENHSPAASIEPSGEQSFVARLSPKKDEAAEPFTSKYPKKSVEFSKTDESRQL
jgi:hypothetical protein